MSLTNRRLLPAIILLSVAAGELSADAFQTAVITLVFPPGARATGLGEAFTAVADDANATFFNPAGLGQSPLAHSWNRHLSASGTSFVTIAARRRKDFSLREKIWVGTARGVMRYNGKAWESHDSYLIEQNDDLQSIARKYLSTEDENLLKRAVEILRTENGIEMKRFKAIRVLLSKEIRDSSAGKADSAAEDLAWEILHLSKSDRTDDEICRILAGRIDSTRARDLGARLEKMVTSEDVELSKLVELKVPFTIAVEESVTALAVDASDKVWVGTRRGLWSFDGSSWALTTAIDGLPGNDISSIAVGKNDEIAVGTERGFAVLTQGSWEGDDLSASGFGDTRVTAIAFDKKETIYVGTASGLVQKTGTNYTLFDTAHGLLSQRVTALMCDADGRLWVGGHNGVAVNTGSAWKRYKFPGSTVYSFAEHDQGRVWIGTDRGAITYKPGRKKLDPSGKTVESPPEWKAFHSKNALEGDKVLGVAVHGGDVWLSTDKAVNQYNYAEKQGLLFWELLLPELKLPDLWHTYGAFIFPTEDWGTFGVTANYLNFGRNELTNEEGVTTDEFQSWEGVFGISYGLMLKQNFSTGISIKYVQSALAPGMGDGDEGVGRTFAIDFGLLRRNLFTPGLDFGLCLQNMGPAIFYVDQKEKDPIPFTVKLGAAYRAVETPIHDLTFLLDLNREIAKNYVTGSPDPFWKAIYTDLFQQDSSSQTAYEKARGEVEEIIFNMGMEYWYVNFLAGRLGFLFDYVGERYELTLGIGIRYGNIDFDFSYIHSPANFLEGLISRIDSDRQGSHGVRHGQPRFSLMFKF